MHLLEKALESANQNDWKLVVQITKCLKVLGVTEAKILRNPIKSYACGVGAAGSTQPPLCALYVCFFLPIGKKFSTIMYPRKHYSLSFIRHIYTLSVASCFASVISFFFFLIFFLFILFRHTMNTVLLLWSFASIWSKPTAWKWFTLYRPYP